MGLIKKLKLDYIIFSANIVINFRNTYLKPKRVLNSKLVSLA